MKFKVLINLLFLLLIAHHGFTQQFNWAKAYNSWSYWRTTKSIATDAWGNIYIGGSFSDSADFNPGTGIDKRFARGHDFYISKYDANGNYLWVKTFSGRQRDILEKILVDNSGDIYMCGYFEDTVDFDPGPGIHNMIAEGLDAFLCKLDASGNFVWAFSIGGVSNDYAKTMLFNKSGNILLGGEFSVIVDFDPSPAAADTAIENTKYSIGYMTDIFLAEYTLSGQFVRVGTIKGDGIKYLYNLRKDALENIYAVGAYLSSGPTTVDIDFDPSPSTIYNVNKYTLENAFILKMDDTCKLERFIDFDADSGRVYCSDIAIDKGGNMYLTGEVDEGFVDFNNSNNPADTAYLYSPPNFMAPGHGYICKLDGAGKFKWLHDIGGNESIGSRMHIDALDNFYAMGTYKGRIDLDISHGPSDTMFVETQFNSCYIIYADSTGKTKWAGYVGGDNNTLASAQLDDAYLSGEHLFLTGIFGPKADFDPGADTAFLLSKTPAMYNNYLVKINALPARLAQILKERKIIDAYPNPSIDGQWILDMEERHNNVTLTIYNINGRVMYTKDYNNTQKIEISISIPAGTYFAIMEAETGKTYISRLLKN